MPILNQKSEIRNPSAGARPTGEAKNKNFLLKKLFTVAKIIDTKAY